MFTDDDRKVFASMQKDMVKDLRSIQKEESKSFNLFGLFLKFWLGWGVFTFVLSGTLFGLMLYIVYHFISKWW
jgi:hypothetical protein